MSKQNSSLNKMNRIIYTGGFGLLVVLISHHIGWGLLPYLIKKEIKSRVVLNNGTEGMEHFYRRQLWEFNVYIFNITNPTQVIQGKRAMVQQLGPYVYDFYRDKVDIEFIGDDALSYKNQNKFFFNSNKSGDRRESDVVTILNVPLLVTAYVFEERFPEGLVHLNTALPYLYPENQKLFINVSVGDILFKGIKVKCGQESDVVQIVCDETKRLLSFNHVPGTEDQAFSYFQKYNSSLSGTYKINRGNENLFRIGNIIELNNLTYLDKWERNSSCSKLKGNDWAIFSPVLETRHSHIYAPEFCLSMKITFYQEMEIPGLKVYRYLVSFDRFQSAKILPKNRCLCKKDISNSSSPRKCTKTGIIDAMKCQGEPYFYSFPQAAFSEYEDDVKYNTNSDQEYLFSCFSFEPRTGVILTVYRRLQKNIFLKKLDKLKILANISSERLIPLVYTEEAMSEEQKQYELKKLSQLIAADRVIMGVCGTFIGLGVSLMLYAYFMYSKFQNYNRVHSLDIFCDIEPRNWFDGYY